MVDVEKLFFSRICRNEATVTSASVAGTLTASYVIDLTVASKNRVEFFL